MTIDFRNTGRMAPEFYILGTAKAGTTAVWSWLRSHPEVFLPKVKEPGYFAFEGKLAEPEQGPYDPNYTAEITTTCHEYGALYSECLDRMAGDVSPVYLASPRVAAKLAAARPDARLIITLRDPVDRAFSQFCHHRRDGLEPLESFEDALLAEPQRALDGWSWAHQYAGLGDYADQIQRYKDVFPAEQILILDYDRLQTEPELCWKEICAHLGLSECPMPVNERMNATQGLKSVPSRPAVARQIAHPGLVQRLLKRVVPGAARKYIRRVLEGRQMPPPVLDAASREMLTSRYAPQRPRLESMTGQRFENWCA